MKHSWREKLDQDGLKRIEAFAKLGRLGTPTSLDWNYVRGWMYEQKAVLESLPDFGKKKKAKLKRKFIRSLWRANADLEISEEKFARMFEMEEFPENRVEELELHQRIYLALEFNREMRFEIYGLVAFMIVNIRRLFSGGLRKQLGSKVPTRAKFISAIAQNVEWFGHVLRGSWKEPPGRVNVELAGLVDAILEHQKEPLTQVELYEAVKAAGGQVPEDPEAFRLWLHRARKQGLVKTTLSSRSRS